MRLKNAGESLKQIVWDYKRMKALESKESAVRGKPFIGAQKGRGGKRGPSEMTPLDGEVLETTASRTERTLHYLAEVIHARVGHLERAIIYRNRGKEPPATEEWEKRRQAVLAEVDTLPIEAAYLHSYTSDRPIRELRIRHGRNEHSGHLLKSEERPLTRRAV